MPKPIEWTKEQDATLRRLRVEERASWDVVAEACGVSRWTAVTRGRGLLVPEIDPEPEPEPPGAHNQVMTPGHAVSWGAIMANTPSLGNAAYNGAGVP